MFLAYGVSVAIFVAIEAVIELILIEGGANDALLSSSIFNTIGFLAAFVLSTRTAAASQRFSIVLRDLFDYLADMNELVNTLAQLRDSAASEQATVTQRKDGSFVKRSELETYTPPTQSTARFGASSESDDQRLHIRTKRSKIAHKIEEIVLLTFWCSSAPHIAKKIMIEKLDARWFVDEINNIDFRSYAYKLGELYEILMDDVTEIALTSKVDPLTQRLITNLGERIVSATKGRARDMCIPVPPMLNILHDFILYTYYFLFPVTLIPYFRWWTILIYPIVVIALFAPIIVDKWLGSPLSYLPNEPQPTNDYSVWMRELLDSERLYGGNDIDEGKHTKFIFFSKPYHDLHKLKNTSKRAAIETETLHNISMRKRLVSGDDEETLLNSGGDQIELAEQSTQKHRGTGAQNNISFNATALKT